MIRIALLCLVLIPGLGAAPARTAEIVDGASSEARAMDAALTAMARGDWDGALTRAADAGEVGRDLVEWHRLRAGRGDFDDARAFLDRRADWPGLPLLRARIEDEVPIGRRAEDVIAFFRDEPPQTGAGSLALAAAYDAVGRRADAEAQIVLAWLSQDFSVRDEAETYARFGDVIAPYHEARLDHLLWEGSEQEAARMIPRVGSDWQALARARQALRDDRPGVDGLIEAVPPALRNDPGLAYERFRWRLRRDRDDSAVELMLDQGASGAGLGRPDEWSGSRRTLAHAAMRRGDAQTAYRIAAENGMTQGSNYAQLEWLAGFVALTDLGRPTDALAHFERFKDAVVTPISLGRAGYWRGRALEALGRVEEAQAAYAEGGRWQTSFYGLLAAERAGLEMDPALTGTGPVAPWREAGFADSSVLRAALVAYAAGRESLTERFLAHMVETLEPPEIAALAEVAFELGEPHIALMIGKAAAMRGIVVPKAYYPVVDLGADNSPVPEEWALSIARRESEFDPVVASGVGAQGLMQLMPGTAREVAGWLNLPYSRSRLTADPAYNATLGTAYLGSLFRRFGPNPIMVSAGYNAGPGRPIRWSESRGDPRSASVDAIDWIEHIPFRETRNYVMRVAESLPVYRARLTGEVQPLDLSRELKRR